MKKLFLLTAIIITFNLSAQSDLITHTLEEQEMAKNIAEQWFRLLIKGNDLDSLMLISGIPFALDRKEILNSTEDLAALYTKIIKSKGQRELPKTMSEVYKSKYEIIEDIIPINALLIRITIYEDDVRADAILISVGIIGNEMKVIGFSD